MLVRQLLRVGVQAQLEELATAAVAAPARGPQVQSGDAAESGGLAVRPCRLTLLLAVAVALQEQHCERAARVRHRAAHRQVLERNVRALLSLPRELQAVRQPPLFLLPPAEPPSEAAAVPQSLRPTP